MDPTGTQHAKRWGDQISGELEKNDGKLPGHQEQQKQQERRRDPTREPFRCDLHPRDLLSQTLTSPAKRANSGVALSSGSRGNASGISISAMIRPGLGPNTR